MALDMVDWTATFVNPEDARKIRVRLGINTGKYIWGFSSGECGASNLAPFAPTHPRRDEGR